MEGAHRLGENRCLTPKFPGDAPPSHDLPLYIVQNALRSIEQASGQFLSLLGFSTS